MNSATKKHLKWLAPIHAAFRRCKMDEFLLFVGEKPKGSLLDVGGGLGISGEFQQLYRQFTRVTVVNLHLQRGLQASGSHVRQVLADGRAMPFANGTFDWVFSNALIEHVGNWARQRELANEIRRLAAIGYYVSTPNKSFPIEPHTLLPLWQFLPPAIQRPLLKVSPGYLTEFEEIHLLSKRQMQHLFPEARVKSIGLPLVHNSLVAFYSEDLAEGQSLLAKRGDLKHPGRDQ